MMITMMKTMKTMMIITEKKSCKTTEQQLKRTKMMKLNFSKIEEEQVVKVKSLKSRVKRRINLEKYRDNNKENHPRKKVLKREVEATLMIEENLNSIWMPSMMTKIWVTMMMMRMKRKI
jgi:hypothetical protein